MIDIQASFPRIRLVRKDEVGKIKRAKYFGPYTSPRALKIALRFIRRLLPYCEYSFSKGKKKAENSEIGWFAKPCLYYHLGLCPGICAGEISVEEYRRRIRQLIYFFDGRKDKVITELEREMKRLSKNQQYEAAARLRNSWEALYHLKNISLMRGAFEEKTMGQRGAVPHRIEAFDVSNIFGNYAVGAMIVFTDGQPDKNEYKRFRIKTVKGISDVGALVEVLRRRMQHSNLAYSRPPSADSHEQDVWTLPNLIMIDGGKGQLNAAVKVLTEFGAQIPLLAVAKGRERKRADQYYYGSGRFHDERLVRRVRDEAHRFAINYYRILHRKALLEK
jgi:excinuclease ABC subunit C